MGYRINPILLRLGKKSSWINNNFYKYDYRQEILRGLTVYTYLDAILSNQLFRGKAILFSHMTIGSYRGTSVVNIHLYDRRLLYVQSRKLSWRLNRDAYRRRYWWLRRYRIRRLYKSKQHRIYNIYLIFLKFIFPYIRHYHLIQYNRYTGVVRTRQFILSRFIASVFIKHNLFNALYNISRLAGTKSFLAKTYFKLLTSLKNYLLTVLRFIDVLNYILSNKHKLGHLLTQSKQRQKSLTKLLEKRYFIIRHIQRRLRQKRLITRASYRIRSVAKRKRLWRREVYVRPLSTVPFKVRSRYATKLSIKFSSNYRHILSKILVNKPITSALSITSINTFLLRLSLRFLGPHYNLVSRKIRRIFRSQPTVQRYPIRTAIIRNYLKAFKKRQQLIKGFGEVVISRRPKLYILNSKYILCRLHRSESNKKGVILRKRTSSRRVIKVSRSSKGRPYIRLFKNKRFWRRRFVSERLLRRVRHKQLLKLQPLSRLKLYFKIRSVRKLRRRRFRQYRRYLLRSSRGSRLIVNRHTNTTARALKRTTRLCMQLHFSNKPNCKKYLYKIQSSRKFVKLRPFVRLRSPVTAYYTERLIRSDSVLRKLTKGKGKAAKKRYKQTSRVLVREPLQIKLKVGIAAKRAGVLKREYRYIRHRLLRTRQPVFYRTILRRKVTYQGIVNSLFQFFMLSHTRKSNQFNLVYTKKLMPVFRFRFIFSDLSKVLRRLRYLVLLNSLKLDLSRILGRDALINVISVHKGSYHPILIAKFITFRLMYQFRLGEVIYPLLKELRRARLYSKIRGIMIICSGRLTRRQRASKKVYRQGKIGISTIKNNIIYAFDTVRLRYGVSGIKVYINKLSNV